MIEVEYRQKEEELRGYLAPVKRLLILLMVFGFIIQVIFPAPFLSMAINYVVLAAVMVSLPFTGPGTRIVCAALFLSGSYFIYTSGWGWSYGIEAMGRNINLISLLITIPLLGLPLKLGGYISVLDALASKYMRKKNQMYLVPAIFSHILGVFMNVGAVPLTYEITARGRITNHQGLLARSISRGFGAALLWSPNMIATSLVLGYLAVPWQSYVKMGVLFAVVCLLTGFLMDIFQKEEGIDSGSSADPPENQRIDRFRLFQVIFAAFIFLSIIIIIETKTDMRVIDIVSLMALIFPAVCLFLLGRGSSVGKGYTDYFRNSVGRYDGEVVLFVAAGFFSSAFAVSGWSDQLCSYVMYYSTSMASVALIVLVIIMITSIVGIHPMIPVSAFATSLNASAMGINPVDLALVLIIGWSLGAIASPMSGTNLVVGSLTGKTSAQVAYSNLVYSLSVSALVVLYMALWAG